MKLYMVVVPLDEGRPDDEYGIDISHYCGGIYTSEKAAKSRLAELRQHLNMIAEGGPGSQFEARIIEMDTDTDYEIHDPKIDEDERNMTHNNGPIRLSHVSYYE